MHYLSEHPHLQVCGNSKQNLQQDRTRTTDKLQSLIELYNELSGQVDSSSQDSSSTHSQNDSNT